MAKRNSADVQLFMIGGYDVLNTLTDIEDVWDVSVEETHTLGDSWVARAYTGVRSAKITQQGFYDDAAGSVHDALSAGLGQQSRVLVYGVEGTATGARVIGFAGQLEVKYLRSPKRGELHKARAEYVGDGPCDDIRVVRWHNVATASGDSTGAPVDNGVSTTWGGAAYLQVSALQNVTNMTVSLLHSADNITYTALQAFAANTSGNVSTAGGAVFTPPVNAAQRIALPTGTLINRYVADRRVFTGFQAGSSTTKYFSGIARNGAT